MSQQLVAVPFHQDTLLTIEHDGDHYVAVRPIVENMGLEWSTQKQKLDRNPKFNCCLMATVAKDGKIREVLCLPIKKLNGWLFSINPERVRSEIRPIVEQYQEECFAVLHDYWHKGSVVNHNHYHNTHNHITVMPDPVSGKEFIARIQNDGTWSMRELGGDEFILNMNDVGMGLPYGLARLNFSQKIFLLSALTYNIHNEHTKQIATSKKVAGV